MQRLKIYAILLSAITISYFGGISLKQKIRTLTTAAIIAAAYAALTLLLAPISYGAVQFRVSEALTVLPFFTPAAVPGLFVGCLVANLIAGVNPVDFVVGSGATLLAALLSYLLGRRSRGLSRCPRCSSTPSPSGLSSGSLSTGSGRCRCCLRRWAPSVSGSWPSVTGSACRFSLCSTGTGRRSAFVRAEERASLHSS